MHEPASVPEASHAALRPIVKSPAWLFCLEPRPLATLRLVCFPFGGGGAGTFWSWRDALPEQVEVWAVRLPGRENRAAEACVTDATAAVECIVAELGALAAGRSVFFGHSLGAGLAFQTAMALRARSLPLPELLVVSGRLPPHLPYPGSWQERPDDELLKHAVELGGIPADLLAQRALLAPHLPKLRADYRLNADLFYGRTTPFDFALLALYGTDDPLVDEAGLREWAQVTRGAFELRRLSGGHFPLLTHADQFLAALTARLRPLLGADAAA